MQQQGGDENLRIVYRKLVMPTVDDGRNLPKK
jgi:hypothetical protein